MQWGAVGDISSREAGEIVLDMLNNKLPGNVLH